MTHIQDILELNENMNDLDVVQKVAEHFTTRDWSFPTLATLRTDYFSGPTVNLDQLALELNAQDNFTFLKEEELAQFNELSLDLIDREALAYSQVRLLTDIHNNADLDPNDLKKLEDEDSLETEISELKLDIEKRNLEWTGLLQQVDSATRETILEYLNQHDELSRIQSIVTETQSVEQQYESYPQEIPDDLIAHFQNHYSINGIEEDEDEDGLTILFGELVRKLIETKKLVQTQENQMSQINHDWEVKLNDQRQIQQEIQNLEVELEQLQPANGDQSEVIRPLDQDQTNLLYDWSNRGAEVLRQMNHILFVTTATSSPAAGMRELWVVYDLPTLGYPTLIIENRVNSITSSKEYFWLEIRQPDMTKLHNNNQNGHHQSTKLALIQSFQLKSVRLLTPTVNPIKLLISSWLSSSSLDSYTQDNMVCEDELPALPELINMVYHHLLSSSPLN